MAVVWRRPGISGTEATEIINSSRERPLSQRTILTILSRLDAKGYVTHSVSGRAYLYTAAVPEREFVAWHAQRAVSELLDRYGDDIVISGIVDSRAGDPDALRRIDDLLEQLRERKT
jgi:predicted transcriptional regulator